MARRKEVPEPKPGLPNLDKYLSGRKKKYVSYVEGAQLYQLPYQSFVRLAKSAKANLRVRKTVIIDIDLIEQYLKDNFEEAIYYDSDAVFLWYERPADTSDAVQEKRAGYGQGYYDKYAGKPSDSGEPSGEVIRWYRVRKTWADSKSQKGAYKILDNAKKCADQNPGYKVFDADGKAVYEPKAEAPTVKVPFLVRISVPDLNIRTGPGTDYPRTGMFTGIGTFTIVEVKEGKGSSEGWGRLKSGAGWIALSLVKRV